MTWTKYHICYFSYTPSRPIWNDGIKVLLDSNVLLIWGYVVGIKTHSTQHTLVIFWVSFSIKNTNMFSKSSYNGRSADLKTIRAYCIETSSCNQPVLFRTIYYSKEKFYMVSPQTVLTVNKADELNYLLHVGFGRVLLVPCSICFYVLIKPFFKKQTTLWNSPIQNKNENSKCYFRHLSHSAICMSDWWKTHQAIFNLLICFSWH